MDVGSTMTLTVVAAHSSEETTSWHLRVGRTASHQVMDAPEERWSAPNAAGLQLTVAEPIPSATPLMEQEGLLTKVLVFEAVTPQALVEGSSFRVAPEPEEGAPHLASGGNSPGAMAPAREANGADGEISSTATGLFPYGRHALTPRLGPWAIASYG